ncbi:MAG: hypothetical protein OCD02_17205 [Spirochaetaceae bacterium]
MEKVKINNLALNFCSIPEKPILSRKIDWNTTIEEDFDNDDINLGYINHLFCRNIKEELLDIKNEIINIENIKYIKVIHETSYLGFPYQLFIKYQTEEGIIEIFYDGMMIFFTMQIEENSFIIEQLNEKTSSELAFRNQCLSISRKLNIEIHWIPNPFWDVLYNNLEDLKLKTDADYPVFKLDLNDNRFFSLTNIGDKQIHNQGRLYSVYFGENKKVIRDRICLDILLYNDFELFQNKLSKIQKQIIKLNDQIINSLHGVPSNLLHIFKRFKSWNYLKNIPKTIFDLESIYPKYLLYTDKLEKYLEYGVSYINIPFTMWIVGQERDKKENTQRVVPHFYKVKIESDLLVPIDNNPVKPLYSNFNNILRKQLIGIEKELKMTRNNLNDAISIYSTNFGFDALVIAIIAVISSVFPLTRILYLLKSLIETIRRVLS